MKRKYMTFDEWTLVMDEGGGDKIRHITEFVQIMLKQTKKNKDISDEDKAFACLDYLNMLVVAEEMYATLKRSSNANPTT